MLNSIKMDLYRLFKAKVFYVTIIIATISVIASLGTARYQLDHPEFQEMMRDAIEQTDDMGLEIGIQGGNVAIVNDDTSTEDVFIGTFAGGIFLVMGVVFCIVFVCTEHNSGYIKNIVSRKGYRGQMSASKSVAMVVYTLVQFAVGIGTFLIMYAILFDGFHFTSAGNFFRYIGIQALIQVALMNLCILFSNVVRNMAFSMAFGICVSAGLFSLVTSLIDKFNLPIDTTDYLLSILMKRLPMTYDSTLYIRALVISIISIAVYQAASLITMKKQDIK